MPKIAGYLRVSSKSQDLGMQRLAIQRAAAARGDEITAWYSEKASAKVMARAELERLRADARAGLVSRVYAYRLDRFCRTGIRDTFDLIEEFRSVNVSIVTTNDGFDLNGPAADVILAVMAWSARMERQAINERIASARERVEAEGRKWGRPSRFDPADIQTMKAMQQAGRTIREIAVAMKVPRSTVARALSRKDAPAVAA